MLIDKEYSKVRERMMRTQRTYAGFMYKKPGKLTDIEIYETKENFGGALFRANTPVYDFFYAQPITRTRGEAACKRFEIRTAKFELQ